MAEIKRGDDWDPFEVVGKDQKTPLVWDATGANMQDWNFQENGSLAFRHQASYNGNWYLIRTTQGVSSGQAKFQLTFSDVSGNVQAGVVGTGCGLGYGQYQTNANPSFCLHGGNIYRHNAALASGKPNIANGSVVQVALDFDADRIEFWHNGSSLGTYSGIAGQTFHPAISCTHYQIKVKVVRLPPDRKQAPFVSREPAGFSTQDRFGALHRQVQQYSASGGDRPLNIFIVGRVGSGKSTTINTLLTAFQSEPSAPICDDALAHADPGHVSTVVRSFQLPGTNIVLWDCWGYTLENFEKGELNYMLDGHLKDGFEMGKVPKLGNPHFRQQPGIEHMMHGVLFLVSAEIASEKDDWKKRIEEFRKVVQGKDHRGVLALTKIDLVDPRLKLRPEKAYQSAVIDELVDRVADKSGFAEKNIHRCKLYHNESDRNVFVEMMAMAALADVVRQAEKFYKDLAALTDGKGGSGAFVPSSGERKMPPAPGGPKAAAGGKR